LDDYSTAFAFSEEIVAKDFGDCGGYSVKFLLFGDDAEPEAAGLPQGRSLGAPS